MERLDLDGYRNYLVKIGFSSIQNYLSYINMLLSILDNIDEFNDMSPLNKIKEFANKPNEFKKIFNQYHNYSSDDTFNDLRSGARKYILFMKYKKVIEILELYSQNQNNFPLNGAHYFFKIFNQNISYPIKAICRPIKYELDLDNNFTKDQALNKLQTIFGNTNIIFFDNDTEPIIITKPEKYCTKNIILYGSPGVGKTYNTNTIIRLIEDGKPEKEIFETIKQNGENDGVDISDIKDRVKFITFHQSFGYEDFIEGFRPNEDGKIELEDGVFKKICYEAQKNLDNSKRDKSFDFEDFLNDFIQEVESQNSFFIDENLIILSKKKINGEFQSFKVGGRVKNQSLTKDIIQRDFENFLEGKITKYQDIKPTYESQSSYHGNAPYYFKLYTSMKKYLNICNQSYESQKSELQNYYLVIDEINRGNISKIFGELITLIEEDKRDTLEVILPYSKKLFKIPSNLYIIGTMNSTDKSIALIDIALRRRFTFLKMKPNPKLVKNEQAKKIMSELNEKITKTLGEDYVLGHSYFMKIKSDEDLEFILEYKIEPLLEEYYYGDDKGKNEALKICSSKPIEE